MASLIWVLSRSPAARGRSRMHDSSHPFSFLSILECGYLSVLDQFVQALSYSHSRGSTLDNNESGPGRSRSYFLDLPMRSHFFILARTVLWITAFPMLCFHWTIPLSATRTRRLFLPQWDIFSENAGGSAISFNFPPWRSCQKGLAMD